MRSMRGSTSAVNGFPLIFRVIFRFIFESAFGSGLRYMMVTKSSGKSKGWAGRASRAGAGGEGLGACAGCARLGGIGQICASRAPFGPGAKLDEQSRYHWNQRSWRAAALGAGRAGMDEDEPSGVGDAVWSRFLVATNGKRPDRLRGPAVEMRMGATRRLQLPRLSLGLVCWAVRVSIFLPIKANFR